MYVVFRGALKKIYERDDTTQKTLVLCVSAIKHQPTSSEEVNRSRQTILGATGKTREGRKDGNMVLASDASAIKIHVHVVSE